MTGAEAHYKTLTLDQIALMNIPEITDRKGAALFLWTTIPLLREGLYVMEKWGFEYKTSLVWVKTNSLGMGKWFRINTELCLIGITGDVRPFNHQKNNIIYAPPRKHSGKPLSFYEKVEASTGDLMPRIELFARERLEGWDSWGNELPKTEQKRLELGSHKT